MAVSDAQNLRFTILCALTGSVVAHALFCLDGMAHALENYTPAGLEKVSPTAAPEMLSLSG